MKRTMRFFARLYPPSWRERYGAEFDALLEDAKPSVRDAFDVLWGALKMQMTTWSFGRITLAGSLAGILVAAAIFFALPVSYVSHSSVIVTTSTGESGRQPVSNFAQDIFSREYLASVILEHNLYPRERARMPLDNVIDKMKRNITFGAPPPASPGNQDTLTFVVKFRYSDAHLAQQVNEELISRFMKGTLNATQLYSCCTTFRVVDPPSIPIGEPVRNRTQFAILGLLAGLLAGLTLAIVSKSRRTKTV